MADLSNEMAYLRHLASNGDKAADALVKVFDDLRNQGRELVIADAASTANIASLSGFGAVDGVTPVDGSVLLLKNQSTTSQNGLWVAHSGASIATD